jgi:ATP-dependent helicase/nuclease subunit A
MVLANRFAWLLTEKGFHVDEILTLTFTKKAAAQMYRRIHSLLGEIAEEDTGIKGERAREALNDFIHARIQTLDSYSASLVKQAASRYGVSPDFTIDEERCRTLALEEALPFLISHRYHPAVERLYSQKGPEAIATEVFAAAIFNYSHFDEEPGFMRDMEKQFDIICIEWENQCLGIKKELKKLAGLISDDESLYPDLVPPLNKLSSGKIKFPKTAEIRAYFDALLNIPPESCINEAESHPMQDSLAEALEFISELSSFDLRKGKKYDNPVKKILKQFKETVFGEFSSLVVFCMQAGFMLSIMFLLSNLQQRYLNKKRAEGIMTFTDAARLARTILLEQEDIRQSEKASFKAIMIDEFQDNNELQKDLLFLLAEKPELMNKGVPGAQDLCRGKLFFVGDEKQSVYRFRGADVSVFRKLKDEFSSSGELQSGDLPLTINYRSAPQLIGAFNAVFGGSDFDPLGKAPLSQNPSVFAPTAKSGTAAVLPLYEASYTPLQAGSDGEGKLTVCILDKNDEEESDAAETDLLTPRLQAVENEARFVAERIQQLLKEKNESGEPKYRPDDIAILFRARSPQHLFEKHLRQLNIPYAGEDLNGFFFGGLVNDIMSVLRLAAYPLDTAAYAEMLRSPFVGLTLPALASCLAFFNKAETPEPFTNEPVPHLSGPDQLKYRQGQELYSLIRGKACRESVSSLVSELWYSQGYRYETEWNPQTSVYRELYDYLFHLAAKADADNLGLAAFTDSIQALRDSGERLSDVEIPLERPSVVHLLTVHKSKGLEFPVVFLCCCDKHSRRSGGSNDVYDTGGAGIGFNPPLPPRCSAIPKIRNNFFWERSRIEEQRKRTAELRRLLYVGMTRAEKELYITGCLGVEADNSGTMDDFSLLLKSQIEKKMEAANNHIPGDLILDNDTFFGLCLPALSAFIPPEGLKAQPSFFSLETIPAYTEDHVNEWENQETGLSNDQKGLNVFFKNAEPFYKNAQKIETPIVRNNRLTPTSLHCKDENPDDSVPAKGSVFSKEFSGRDACDVFEKVNALLARYADQDEGNAEKFNSGSFGTIAHACADSLLRGEEPAIPTPLAGFLNPKEAAALLEAGKELAVRFLGSPLGKLAQSAKLRQSEFPFRSLIHDLNGNEVFINGTIDLLFEDENTVHVVDFKTDSREIPSDHSFQLACYYRAAYSLFAAPVKKPCRVWLYYLRTGHAVEMTERIKRFDLERRVM